MSAVEFQTSVVDGQIQLPDAVRDRFQGVVNVIVYDGDEANGPSAWPVQNRRRWELIAQKARQGLGRAEEQELAELQERADDRLAQVGPRPTDDLEQLYAGLTQD